jgi:predicted transposase/invertase (TIGR01784 family)
LRAGRAEEGPPSGLPQRTSVSEVRCAASYGDVYFEDDKEHVYDIEMQNSNQYDIQLRARYYQGMIDMDQTVKGAMYRELRENYVIFISTFDPFGMGYSRYIARTMVEDPSGIPYAIK